MLKHTKKVSFTDFFSACLSHLCKRGHNFNCYHFYTIDSQLSNPQEVRLRHTVKILGKPGKYLENYQWQFISVLTLNCK